LLVGAAASSVLLGGGGLAPPAAGGAAVGSVVGGAGATEELWVPEPGAGAPPSTWQPLGTTTSLEMLPQPVRTALYNLHWSSRLHVPAAASTHEEVLAWNVLPASLSQTQRLFAGETLPSDGLSAKLRQSGLFLRAQVRAHVGSEPKFRAAYAVAAKVEAMMMYFILTEVLDFRNMRLKAKVLVYQLTSV